MRTKLVTVTVSVLLAAMLPTTAASGAPLGCPGLVEVEGGWLLTQDVACGVNLIGVDATLDLGGHTLTGGLDLGGGNQTVRNGTVVITGFQGWYSATLSHVTVRPLVPGDCLLWCIDAGRLTIEHSTFRDIGGAALNFYNGGNATIRHSTFIGNGAAIVVDLGSDVRMENNWFVQNQSGIGLNTHDGDGVNRNTIRNNVFWGNRSGLSMSHHGEYGGWGLSENTVQGNWFVGNERSGLNIRVSCSDESECTYPVGNVVEGNVFWGNGFRPSPGSSGDDGITARGVWYHSDGSTPGDFPEALAGFTLTGNQAFFNADLGFDVAGVVDGGRNQARLNGDRAQCAGVACRGWGGR